MTDLQAYLLAILQGVSELFPISSLGHTVIVPALLHWNVDRRDPTFLAFVVVLHLGTALALLIFYWNDWVKIVRALVLSIVRGKFSNDPAERIAWLLVVGTVPVGLLGVFLKDPVQQLFGSTAIVAIFLMLNAGVMFVGESLGRRARMRAAKATDASALSAIEHVSGARALATLPWIDGAKIGVAQALALFPGISRSGSSIVAGLLLDLDHDDAARYSFLLATPAIGAAAVLEIPELFKPGTHVIATQAAVGGVLAGLTAYASVAFLTRYFHSNDLRPFGWYCLIAGGATLALALTKVIS